MQRFLGQAAVALVVAVTVAGSAAGSAGVKPPRGIPDLSKMALRVSDLPAGAKVEKQGYVSTSSVAEYDRSFKPRSVRVGRKRLIEVESDISLETSSLTAASEFAQVRRLLSSKSGRKQLADAVQQELGVLADSVRVGLPFRFGVGEESLGLTITVVSFVGTIQEALGFFRVDRVVSILVLAGGPGTKLGRRDVAALGRPVAVHIHDGLVPLSTAPPTVAGAPIAGQTLSAVAGTWVNGPVSFAYQWQRCDPTGAGCADIPGATSSSYLLLDDDVARTVRVEVTATNAYGSTVKASAVTTAVAEPAGAPINVQLPAIAGAAAQGQTLTASTGVWVGKPTAFAYQWQRCDAGGGSCVPVDGAVSSTYAVTSADAGMTLRVAVTATNASGSSTVASAPTAAVG